MPESVDLSPAECARAAWAIEPDGTRHRGAGAVLAALSWAIGVPGLTRLYRVPVLRQALDLSYALIARARGHLPGAVPYCETHRDECGAGKD